MPSYPPRVVKVLAARQCFHFGSDDSATKRSSTLNDICRGEDPAGARTSIFMRSSAEDAERIRTGAREQNFRLNSFALQALLCAFLLGRYSPNILTNRLARSLGLEEVGVKGRPILLGNTKAGKVFARHFSSPVTISSYFAISSGLSPRGMRPSRRGSKRHSSIR
jgi:hypothetical protein